MDFFEKVKKYRADLLDVGLTKWAVFSATLLLAKLWQPILSLDWYWYLLLFMIALIRPMANFINQMNRR